MCIRLLGQVPAFRLYDIDGFSGTSLAIPKWVGGTQKLGADCSEKRNNGFVFSCRSNVELEKDGANDDDNKQTTD
jgi:hypothetical protein